MTPGLWKKFPSWLWEPKSRQLCLQKSRRNTKSSSPGCLTMESNSTWTKTQKEETASWNSIPMTRLWFSLNLQRSKMTSCSPSRKRTKTMQSHFHMKTGMLSFRCSMNTNRHSKPFWRRTKTCTLILPRIRSTSSHSQQTTAKFCRSIPSLQASWKLCCR